MALIAQDDVFSHLERGFGTCMAIDRVRLSKVLERLRRSRGATLEMDAQMTWLASAVADSQARRDQRLAKLPRPNFPPELPVALKRDEIARAVAANPVTIVCGETGSGKTTQLPKICLELQRGTSGLIGHTQPRRIAARAVANRIAQELGTPLGEVVGYKVRFQDKVDAGAYIKVMTDGILLAEAQGDQLLGAYDTLIIDEAHERSLNIDFLLGLVRRVLPRRPDLKLIITSATIDAERFSRHFGGAPVVEVSGRLYPVEIRYRERARNSRSDDENELTAEILHTVDEVSRLGPGHILVFLPGEREIRETAEEMRKHHPHGAEILPLYARLSAAEQERVFAPTNARRIVLATNVAETSLTVPGIRFVIDPGFARVNRYSYRNKVEQLITEKIAQASANQRAGRCGRLMSGVCYRLYSQEDFAARPAFGDPELLRSSLAAVILRMKALELGDVENFPFIDPPQPRMVADGYQLLAELDAVDEGRSITALGRELARLPIDPRIGRMLIEARAQHCLSEALIVGAALSIQDPRERPMERAQAADDRHAAFRDERSDFLGLLKLWRFYDELIRHKKSSRRLAQELREHFLSPLRMREWREVHGQLHTIVSEMGMRLNQTHATYEQLHRALLAGLLGNIGLKNEQGEYDGARGIRFAIHPGSGLRKRGPQWLMAAELVETTRLFARGVAQIEAQWVEQAASHLVKRSWFEPRWNQRRAQPVAWEQVSLYGLVLIARRQVPYAPIDPAHAREIFVRAGLIDGGFVPDAPFHRHNLKLRRELEELEHKSRRRDVLVDEHAMFRFFDAHIPADVCTGKRFEAWRREAEQNEPRLLFIARSDLMRRDAEWVSATLFPEDLELPEIKLRLRYRFDPGHPLDGVTATIPLHTLNKLHADTFTWLVPGMLRDKVNALVRALPKQLRRECVPLPETVTACLQDLDTAKAEQSLCTALAQALKRVRGIDVPGDAFSDELAPAHLRMNFRVTDDSGAELGCGRDLRTLQSELGVQAEAEFAPQSPWEQSGMRAWDSLVLPEAVEFNRGGARVTGYPALIDEQDSVRLTLLETQDKAIAATRPAVCRLVRLELKDQLRALERTLTPSKQLTLSYAPYGSAAQLAESLLRASIERAVWADAVPVRNRAQFDARLKQVRARLQIIATEYLRMTEQILNEAHAVRKDLAGSNVRAFKPAASDLTRQLQALVYPGFLADVAYTSLQHYPRYLKAMRQRIEKLSQRAERDEQHTRELSRWWQQLQQRLERNRKNGTNEPGLDAFRWMLEEQRVSLFAQELRTPYPVSYKRLERAWANLDSA
jgi:ATP-dependent helicase HrpA